MKAHRGVILVIIYVSGIEKYLNIFLNLQCEILHVSRNIRISNNILINIAIIPVLN